MTDHHTALIPLRNALHWLTISHCIPSHPNDKGTGTEVGGVGEARREGNAVRGAGEARR